MPCSGKNASIDFPEHPASKMQQKGGELVSHDVLRDPLCASTTGSRDFKVGKTKEKVDGLKMSQSGVLDDDSEINESGEDVGVEIVGLLK